jgi:glycosyltransferase involved in cell wall biosynthesis
MERTELRRRLPGWRGLVFPSRCLEGAPLVQAEALAAGLPVLVFEGSSVAESVRAQGTGTVVSWDQDLAPVLAEAAGRFPGLRGHCRHVFEDCFSQATWLRSMQDLYAEVLRARSPQEDVSALSGATARSSR